MLKEEGRRKKEVYIYGVYGDTGPQLITGYLKNGRGIKPAASIIQMSNNIVRSLG
jgi:hypothetical protein